TNRFRDFPAPPRDPPVPKQLRITIPPLPPLSSDPSVESGPHHHKFPSVPNQAPVLNHNEHRAESILKNHYGVFPPQPTFRPPTHNRAPLNNHYRVFPPQPTVRPPTHHRVAPVPSPSSTY
ncbi:hypothetical protein Salat_2066900, partial [Sesamum alatum]